MLYDSRCTFRYKVVQELFRIDCWNLIFQKRDQLKVTSIMLLCSFCSGLSFFLYVSTSLYCHFISNPLRGGLQFLYLLVKRRWYISCQVCWWKLFFALYTFQWAVCSFETDRMNHNYWHSLSLLSFLTQILLYNFWLKLLYIVENGRSRWECWLIMIYFLGILRHFRLKCV